MYIPKTLATSPVLTLQWTSSIKFKILANLNRRQYKQLKLHLHLYRLLATTTKYIININFTLKQSSENLDC